MTRYRDGWRLLGREMLRQRAALVRVAAWSVPESLPALTSGLLVAHALDDGFLVRRPWTGLCWLCLLGLALAGQAVATRMSFPWLSEVVEPLRDSLVRMVVDGTLRRAAAGSGRPDTASVAQLTSQIETTRLLTSALIRSLRPLACSVLAAVVGLAVLSPVVAGLVVPPLVLALALYVASIPAMSRPRARMVAATEATAAQAGAVLAGLRDVIACGAQDRAVAETGAAIDGSALAARAVAWSGSFRTAVVAVGYYVPLTGLLAAAPWLAAHGRLTDGQVAGAVTYLSASIWPALNSFTGSVGAWGIELGSVLRRLSEVCSPAPIPPVPGSGQLPAGSELRVSRLTFGYSATAEPVIRDLSLTLDGHDHLAVVGPSGIGKSTLAQLIAGLQAGQRGRVTLGGVPLGLIPERVLRQRIAVIPQEAYVFTGALGENLTYLRPGGCLVAELNTACAAVGLTSLVTRLGGYQARVGDAGPALSAGERQLIALGRVYLSPATVVILDEATSQLDPAAEARAESAFQARPGTLIVIAHRISSAMRARRVLVLDGDSAVLGTPAELMARSPLFADLTGNWTPAPA